MEEIMREIIEHLRANGSLSSKAIDGILRKHNKQAASSTRAFAKKQLMPFFLRTKSSNPELWESWSLTPQEESQLVTALRLKPRRTASGVATITVITKPWPCSSNCLYCPNDLRMPKSYMHDEPACQRAERNYFDPYLQVTARLRTLNQMGHVTDKVELIILGGTFSDYPETYQIWFASRLFTALNDAGVSWNEAMPAETGADANGSSTPNADDTAPATTSANVVNQSTSGTFHNKAEAEEARLRDLYESQDFTWKDDALAQASGELQARVNAGELTYNQGFGLLYGPDSPLGKAARWQTATWDELEEQQRINETAAHRCVGMVIETRPDNVTVQSLRTIRRLGCTKVQIGIQSTRPEVLAANNRHTSEAQIAQAFELLRLFGFKSHTHFMANLYGSSPEADVQDYRLFVTDQRFLPDEIKLYPCVLLEGTALEPLYHQGAWQPYSEETLREVLTECVLATPAYTRISRMIRDFSAPDIIAGNKKTNLRQMVDADTAKRDATVQEIRHREIAGDQVSIDELQLQELPYETTLTNEVFLQWVTPEGKIAGFLRLSLPKPEAFCAYEGLPVSPGQAMIREVHVYGKVAAISKEGTSAQHAGLGKKLIARACQIATEAGYTSINVISAIGTRQYYRDRGFADAGLYLRKELSKE